MRTCAGASPSHLLCCASLQRDGPKQRFITEQVRFLFEGRTNGAGRSGPLALFVCKTLHRLLLRGKWPRRPLLKSGKNEGWGLEAFKSDCPEPALMRLHLGTGCSAAALSQSPPAAQQKRCGKSSDPEMWSVSCLRAAPAQEREE